VTEEGNGVRWRLSRVEDRVDRLENANIGALMVRLQFVEAELHEVKTTLRWVLRTLVGIAATILTGALIVAMTRGGP
jgi:hypothetical protein